MRKENKKAVKTDIKRSGASRRVRKTVTSIVSISNQKGGVAKTTTAICVAAELAVRGFSVVLIDADGQGNAGSGFQDGLNPTRSIKTRATLEENTLDKALLSSTMTLESIAYPAKDFPNLKVVASNNQLKRLSRTEVGTSGSQQMLTRLLDRSDLSEVDVVVIDTPPNIGLMFQNAMYASHYYLIPLTAESDPLEGVGDMLDEIKLIKSGNKPLRCLGALITNYFPKRIATHSVVQPLLVKFFKSSKIPYLGEIPFSSSVSSSKLMKLPMPFQKRQMSASKAYSDLVDKLVKEFRGPRRGQVQSTPELGQIPKDLIDPPIPLIGYDDEIAELVE